TPDVAAATPIVTIEATSAHARRVTLPRSAHRYISSFVGFAPAEDPKVLGLCIINNPQGIYYGGTIAAPVIRSIFENVLPYLGCSQSVS
ncbi:MAG: hypothetical protein HFH61_05395, partial [Lachnospiraceae bacterium]|nr:hypothetical protein [Lachnospiraceae bacterium]